MDSNASTVLKVQELEDVISALKGEVAKAQSAEKKVRDELAACKADG